MNKHIAFLSYQTANKHIVRATARYLAKNGIEPILDEWSFRRGLSLQSEIEKSIKRSTCFVLFWSQAAMSSKYVQFEDEIALARRIKDERYRTEIVRLDNTNLPERHSFLLYHDWRRIRLQSEKFQQCLDILKRSILGLPDKNPPVTKSIADQDTIHTHNQQVLIKIKGSKYRVRREPDIIYIEEPPKAPIVRYVKRMQKSKSHKRINT